MLQDPHCQSLVVIRSVVLECWLYTCVQMVPTWSPDDPDFGEVVPHMMLPGMEALQVLPNLHSFVTTLSSLLFVCISSVSSLNMAC